MKKFLLSLIAIVFFSFSLNAQQKFDHLDIRLGGVVTEYFNGNPIKNVEVKAVDKSGKVSLFTTKSDGYYFFQLSENNVYEVSFSKKGKITKKVSINTNEIAYDTDVMLHEMDLQMVLFDSIPNFDFSYFEKPIAESAYKKKIRTMGWKNEYTKIHQEVVDSIMNEYEKHKFGYYEHIKKDGEETEKIIAIQENDTSNAVVELTINDTSLAVATNVEYIPNILYTVQVGVYSKEVPLDMLYGLSMLNVEYLSDGKVRYSSGRFTDENSAQNHKDIMIMKGVKDAFVVKYLNGKLVKSEKKK